jgi:two-component system sensor histidine kinase KdpD
MWLYGSSKARWPPLDPKVRFLPPVPLPANGGHVCNDHTEVRVEGELTTVDELQARVQELERVLADAQRRNDAWLSIVSHDLRGPLTLILGYAENYLNRTRSSRESSRSIQELEAIVNAARRLNKMVSQVVDGARIEGRRLVLNPRSIEVAPLVRDRVRTARRVYPAHRFDVALGNFQALVRCDTRAIETIVSTLLSNAAVFSSSDTPITVSAEDDAGWVRVSVLDRGIGLTEDELARIFERQFRPERAREARREGLGISLWIASELAQLSGGRLAVESSGESLGTTASLWLPVLDAVEATADV